MAAVTVSVGAAIALARTRDVEALLVAADRALDAAKRSGRNCVRLAFTGPSADPDAEAQSDALRMAHAMATVAEHDPHDVERARRARVGVDARAPGLRRGARPRRPRPAARGAD